MSPRKEKRKNKTVKKDIQGGWNYAADFIFGGTAA